MHRKNQNKKRTPKIFNRVGKTKYFIHGNKFFENYEQNLILSNADYGGCINSNKWL